MQLAKQSNVSGISRRPPRPEGLPRSFYARDITTVAQDLRGKHVDHVVRGICLNVVTEVGAMNMFRDAKGLD